MLTVENAADSAARFIEEIPPYPGDFAGRGIVTCAGGVKYLTCAFVLIKMLRHLGCTLPIEVWYLGEDEGDPDWIELVRPLGVTCIDAFTVRERHPHPCLGGWQSKAYALRHTKFQEVLFLDADNVPVVDPTFLFDEPQYRESGAVFWPDGSRTPSSSPAWKLFHVSFRDEREFESGQFLVNKERCWPAVCLADWYNQNSNFFYQYIYGDKDSFRFAWHRLGLPYSMPEQDVTTVPFTLCQHGFDGERLFQHRIHDKWSMLRHRQSSGFAFEVLCVEMVRELFDRWKPGRHLVRNIARKDLNAMSQLEGSRFRYRRIGSNQWRIRLGADARVIEGENPRVCFWWHESGRIVLADVNGRTTAQLQHTSQKTWEGLARGTPCFSIRLEALQ